MTYTPPDKIFLPPELENGATNIYSRMAIYFDAHIYDDPVVRDDDLLYRYLYHICYMLACKGKFFQFLPNSFEKYDEFALYMATRIYMRLINPKYLEKHEKIVSILNYCKTLLRPTKVDFLREDFSEIIGNDEKGNIDGNGDLYLKTLEDNIQASHCKENSYSDYVLEEFDSYSMIVKQVVRNCPYGNDPIMSHRLYMSILLTTLNGITLSNEDLNKLNNKNDKAAEEMIVGLYKKEQQKPEILWRLDPKYTGYVHVLVIKCRKEFATRLSTLKRDCELDPENLNAVIMSSYGNTLRDDNEEF